ncbi:bifunctional lytic transglycosylase/C40 family peptidase [Metabacillus idriensis]|uniref:C40 family peptidase n=1 Tax=Metabacillus idriensis TaxID=324768 RepID=UPI002812B29E|nr:bifunctional lytic transglycosylase/C40 family peptidase [Metabacillus idriensis]MDR0140147.1 bifunctional lytic transglycosylase/C40 family peptidase [Metabacillus idriensis]
MSQINDSNAHETDGSSALKNAAGAAGKAAAKKAAKKALIAATAKAAAATGSTVGLPVVLGLAAAAIVLIGGLIIIAFVILSSTGGEEKMQPGMGYYGGEISELGANEIPAQYLPIYQAAEQKYGVPWNLLAAHHRVETRFSTLEVMVSPVGAAGHMQFMPLTWIGWSYPGGNRLGNANIPSETLTDPIMIKKYGGYGVDANGDGKADPWDIEDAIFSAANYLAANGAAEGDLRRAVFAYNHADWYVEEVLGFADQYVKGYVSVGGGSGENTGIAVVDVGNRWIGNSVYVFGGGRNQSDISRGRFDCSSFVHWAFKEVGVDLGPLTSTSTETLKHLGKPVTADKLQPGDLVFFNTYKRDGHVGIYVGNGKFIGAQSSTGVAIADMSKGYWKDVFNGRVKRI